VGEKTAEMTAKVNLDEPRWDQKTYEGRARLFFNTTNPLNLLCTPGQLDWAKEIVTKHRYVRADITSL
jgi:hypothetical protein